MPGRRRAAARRRGELEGERVRESERVSGRRPKTAKCPIVRRVSDLGHTANKGAHGEMSVRRVSWIWAQGNLFLFSISNDSLQKKKHITTTTLPCAKYMAHGKPYFFSSINSTKFNEMNMAKYYQIN